MILLHVISHEFLDCIVRERLKHGFMILYIRDRVTILHELEVPLLTVSTQHLIRRHRQVEIVREPHLIHNVYDLQSENVLPQIVSVLEEKL